MIRRAIAVAIAVGVAAGCGSKEDATLSVYTQNPSLAKVNGGFTALAGSVDLVLDMGAYSQGSVTVDAVGLRLFRGSLNILARAKFVPSDGTSYPVTINAKDKKVVHYAITIDQMTDAEISELCAGQASIGGTVTQHGNASPMSIGSTPITPTGCP